MFEGNKRFSELKFLSRQNIDFPWNYTNRLPPVKNVDSVCCSLAGWMEAICRLDVAHGPPVALPGLTALIENKKADGLLFLDLFLAL